MIQCAICSQKAAILFMLTGTALQIEAGELTLAYSPWQGSLDQLHSSTVVNGLSRWLQLNDACLRSQGVQVNSLCASADQIHAWQRVVTRVVIGGCTGQLA